MELGSLYKLVILIAIFQRCVFFYVLSISQPKQNGVSSPRLPFSSFLCTLLSLFSRIKLALLGSHVQTSVPAEDYWRSLWPNTPMPKALRDLTQPDSEWRGWNSVSTKFKGITLHSPALTIAYGATSKDSVPTELKDTLNVTTFFLEYNLHPGKKLNLEFIKRSDEFTFLPDKVAKSIPFSSSRFPEILNRFSIGVESTEAERMKDTLEICEKPAINGEDKYCATSLESMVNFTVSKLGKNITVLSTVLEKETQKRQKYNVVEGVQKAGDKAVVCHKLDYPYAVFYCHKDTIRVYTVRLLATADGTKAKGLAVCHNNTIQWSPELVAFQKLNVKPGTVPICHFLVTETLLWVPN